MGTKGYPIEVKIKFLDLYKTRGSVAPVAKAMGLAAGTCKYWVKIEDKIRADYKLSLIPRDLEETQEYTAPKEISLEEKLKCINAMDSGLSVHQVSMKYNYSCGTLYRWNKAKDDLLALYYSQQDAEKSVESPEGSHYSSDIAGEAQMAKAELDKALTQKCKAQAKEIEYLKDRVAFLENLNEILKERSKPVKKKIVLQQSSEASREEDRT